MAILFYLKKRIRRSFFKGLVLALLLGVLCWFASIYDSSMKDKLQEIENAYDSIPVTVVVSNIEGTQTDGLDIPDYLVNYFISEQYTFGGERQDVAFSSYLSDVILKSTLYYTPQTPMDDPVSSDHITKRKLVGVTALEAVRVDPSIGFSIDWFDGYDASVLRTQERVCLVSSETLRKISPGEDGQYLIALTVQVSPASTKDTGLELTVVGCYAGEAPDILCPWAVAAQTQQVLGGYYVNNGYYPGPISADSMSATIRDNRELGAFRELLSRHFAQVDPSGRIQEITGSPVLTHHPFAATIHDETLRGVLSELQKNLRMLERLLPLLTLLQAAISFIVSALYIHNRKQELAVARALGTSKAEILAMVSLEQGLWILLGGFFCILAARLMSLYALPYSIILVILTASLLGAALSSVIYSDRNRIRRMKEED